MMAPTGESPPPYSDYLLYSAIGLGLASALIQLTMNWAQRSVSPTRATVIYAGEPVWAGIVGRLAGERLPGVCGGKSFVHGSGEPQIQRQPLSDAALREINDSALCE
jgi:hypothetical protein